MWGLVAPVKRNGAGPDEGIPVSARIALLLLESRLQPRQSETGDGSDKADVEPKRKLLAGHTKKGGVIRLWPDDAVTQGLAVAEGIENALSAAHAVTPVWACVDAGNMSALPVLDGLCALTIVADHDAAGLKAANALAARYDAASIEVAIIAPPEPGMDANNWVAE